VVSGSYRLAYYDAGGVLCYDPDGSLYGLPTYPWQGAPPGLATYRQLAVMGLRPGGRDPVAQIIRPRGRREPLVGYLYEVDKSVPRREVTEAMRAAVRAAIAAKRRCHGCRRDVGYIPPLRTGRLCWDCAEPQAA
jgi:hypothetical protein